MVTTCQVLEGETRPRGVVMRGALAVVVKEGFLFLRGVVMGGALAGVVKGNDGFLFLLFCRLYY